ncbi:hypothetical protein GDO81_029169 [Engystomops pustulosus]|uniref:Uncharacterized protein n=1 Tax=Engystomops pustulosus TaxID=76066 RepID=A0AAV6Z506_ENGPU|nr:hypothetical protein GDO81_029169 [Engystomops pustulosus]
MDIAGQIGRCEEGMNVPSFSSHVLPIYVTDRHCSHSPIKVYGVSPLYTPNLRPAHFYGAPGDSTGCSMGIGALILVIAMALTFFIFTGHQQTSWGDNLHLQDSSP